MRFSETQMVVLPCMKALDAVGFVVIDQDGKPTWAEVLAILEQYPKTPGVVWRQNVGAATFKGRLNLEAGGFSHMTAKRRFVAFGVPGLADISGVLKDGRRLEIECKRPGRDLDANQRPYRQVMLAMKAIYLTVHSPDELLNLLAIHCGLKG